MNNILEVRDLKKYFARKKGFLSGPGEKVKAVDKVTFNIPEGTTFGLVGESGCGKTTVARLVAGILRPDSGSITLKGEKDMVFQDPVSSLNPRMNVRQIIGEPLYVRGYAPGVSEKKVKDALEMVRLGRNCLYQYPHQFSGGERQRIAVARALVHRPGLLILDEPVSSLDVSIQAGILNLLKDLQDELELTYLFISHDLRVVEFMSHTVAVMQKGRIVEKASAEEIYRSPGHDYTRMLLSSIPRF